MCGHVAEREQRNGGIHTRHHFHASRTIEGASTSFLTFPERGLVVAVSSNMSFADMKTVAMGIAEIFAKRGSAPGRPGA